MCVVGRGWGKRVCTNRALKVSMALYAANPASSSSFCARYCWKVTNNFTHGNTGGVGHNLAPVLVYKQVPPSKADTMSSSTPISLMSAK